MARPAVILVGADKGGVGKTTVARTLIDYFGAHQTPTRAFDTEAPRGTLRRFHPDITDVVDITSTSDQMKIFDTVSTSSAHITVIDIRAGLHSGEVELHDGDVAGIAVHIAARVMALAGASRVLVSGTVKDLVVGSPIRFEDRGEHALKGVPGRWRLFEVAGMDSGQP